MPQTYSWNFPLPRTHTGILQGNGVMGLMIWGAANVLNLTVGRNDFWDHRGGRQWTPEMNYPNLRQLLEAGDEAAILRIFRRQPPAPGQPERPTLLSIGRIEIHFPQGAILRTGRLDLTTGRCVVAIEHAGKSHDVAIETSLHVNVAAVRLPAGIDATVHAVPAWKYVGQQLAAVGYAPPVVLDRPDIAGFVQSRPGEESLCLGHRTHDNVLWLTTEFGHDAPDAAAKAGSRLAQSIGHGADALTVANAKWFADYWRDVPAIDIPQENLRFLYEYGMYKFAGLTHPRGNPAPLQGPWNEEYQLPPWSGDYHFNINVQMCYAPAYRGNRLSHLKPLFELIRSWMPILQDNAKKFVGIDDGLVMPHAVDDRCQIIGSFWTGTIDHGCTAWVGKMMFDYYDYTGDAVFLEDHAYPFMLGALRVYEKMLERDASGKWSLPVSVSPEYRGAAMNAWGRNASFQLACLHWLLESLTTAAAVLGKTPDPKWAQYAADVPRASFFGEGEDRRIALWDGTPLEESHRHHSHLAGITPFDILDPVADFKAIDRSLDEWVERGMGRWSGWCMPWASQLHAHLGNPDMAVLMLDIWQRVFTNEGHGTLHDCNFPGLTLLGVGKHAMRKQEIMQMDAGMGATAAIMELLLLSRRGIHHLFPGCPARFATVAFTNIRTTGGFLVSAKRDAGQVKEVAVVATRPGTFKLKNPWPHTPRNAGGTITQTTPGILEIACRKNETAILRP